MTLDWKFLLVVVAQDHGNGIFIQNTMNNEFECWLFLNIGRLWHIFDNVGCLASYWKIPLIVNNSMVCCLTLQHYKISRNVAFDHQFCRRKTTRICFVSGGGKKCVGSEISRSNILERSRYKSSKFKTFHQVIISYNCNLQKNSFIIAHLLKT